MVNMCNAYDLYSLYRKIDFPYVYYKSIINMFYTKGSDNIGAIFYYYVVLMYTYLV